MAASVTVLAHLSDVHLSPIEGFTPAYWNTKRALGYLNWHRGRVRVHSRQVANQIAADVRNQRPDHIAVTGDLANLGLPAEYRAAGQWLAALGAPAHLSVVPGNHDIYTGRMHGHSCLTEWASYITSDAWGLPFTQAGRTFPYVRRVGAVALIGLNSAIPTPPFVAAGRLGEWQLEDLEKLLVRLRETSLARVVMIHHPPLPGQAPSRRALADAAALQDILTRAGADLVIHGHNHTQTLEWVASVDGAVPVCGVPSASAALAHHDEPLAQYALYRFEASASTEPRQPVERIIRGLRTADGEIVELSRSVLKGVSADM